MLPAGFRFPGMPATDLIVPQPLPAAAPAQRKSGWIYGIGRLRAGPDARRREAEIAALSRQFEREFPEQNKGTRYEACRFATRWSATPSGRCCCCSARWASCC